MSAGLFLRLADKSILPLMTLFLSLNTDLLLGMLNSSEEIDRGDYLWDSSCPGVCTLPDNDCSLPFFRIDNYLETGKVF